MTSSVFVLTIQIERRQCYLSALAQEKIATSVPTMMPVASLVCCFDTRLLPCASFAFICFHLLPSSGGGAPHSLSVSILSLTANLAPVQQTGFCNAGLSLVLSGGASQRKQFIIWHVIFSSGRKLISSRVLPMRGLVRKSDYNVGFWFLNETVCVISTAEQCS